MKNMRQITHRNYNEGGELHLLKYNAFGHTRATERVSLHVGHRVTCKPINNNYKHKENNYVSLTN